MSVLSVVWAGLVVEIREPERNVDRLGGDEPLGGDDVDREPLVDHRRVADWEVNGQWSHPNAERMSAKKPPPKRGLVGVDRLKEGAAYRSNGIGT